MVLYVCHHVARGRSKAAISGSDQLESATTVEVNACLTVELKLHVKIESKIYDVDALMLPPQRI